jgi:hypothetical protein
MQMILGKCTYVITDVIVHKRHKIKVCYSQLGHALESATSALEARVGITIATELNILKCGHLLTKVFDYDYI